MPKQTKPKQASDKLNVTATSNATKDSSVLVVVDVLTLNIFFDGTGNNLYNVKAGVRVNDDASYQNAFSNIAYLYYNRRESHPNTLWVYMEGIGTARGVYDPNMQDKKSSGRGDAIIGMAFGTGCYGVADRVNAAFSEVEAEIQRQYQKQLQATRLVINAFGFSRGAAAARHFVNLAKKHPERFKSFGIKKSDAIQVNFVGLYDTVSSFGVNFDDDEKDLMLSFSQFNSQKSKPKVFQIVALDEYRENFSITHIKSARDGKFGIEVGINGAHSDIGGGYHAQESEEYDTEVNQQVLRSWLIEQGFYKKFEECYAYLGKNSRKRLSHYRATRTVYQGIHKISLKVMRVALEHAIMGIKFKNKIELEEVVTGAIQKEMGHFVTKVDGLCQKGWVAHPNIIPLSIKRASNLPNLRYAYIHWSAKYIKYSIKDTGLKVRLDNNGKPYRRFFNG